jgi:TIR domain
MDTALQRYLGSSCFKSLGLRARSRGGGYAAARCRLFCLANARGFGLDRDSRNVSGSSPKAEIFDVFLCHNSEDKPAVREIAQKLSEENIKAWLDEADIRAGSFWDTAIGQQIETAKSAAFFVGQYGVGPWQKREIIALLDQFDRRGCPVIPAILASAPAKLDLPWWLKSFQCVDFRATDSHALKRLIWGITGKKPPELSDVPLRRNRQPCRTRLNVTCFRVEMTMLRRTKCVSAIQKSPKRGSIRLLPSRPIKSRRPNSKVFDAKSWSIG